MKNNYQPKKVFSRIIALTFMLQVSVDINW